jgi:hypothetical protein
MPRFPDPLHPALPPIPGAVLARPAVQRAAIALVHEAIREVWRARHRAAVGAAERFEDHRLLRALVADLRRRRRRVAREVAAQEAAAFAATRSVAR